jgi:hypothetical protein
LESRILAEGWAKRESSSVNEIRRILSKAGLGEGAIITQTLAVKMRDIEAFDQLITRAEARRALRRFATFTIIAKFLPARR